MHKEKSYSIDRSCALPDLNIGVGFADIVKALKRLNKQDREEFIENLLAATSPKYIESIREAREDYRKGRVSSHSEAFREKKKK